MKIKLPDLSKFQYTHTGQASALTPFGWAVADLVCAFTAFHYHRDAGGVLFTVGSALFSVAGFQDLRKIWPNFAKPTETLPSDTPLGELAKEVWGPQILDSLRQEVVTYPLPEDNQPGLSESIKSATISWGSGQTTHLDPATIIINPITPPEVPNVSPSETQSATKYIPLNYPED